MFLEKNALSVKIKACLKISKGIFNLLKRTLLPSEVDTRRLQMIPLKKKFFEQFVLTFLKCSLLLSFINYDKKYRLSCFLSLRSSL